MNDLIIIDFSLLIIIILQKILKPVKKFCSKGLKASSLLERRLEVRFKIQYWPSLQDNLIWCFFCFHRL